MTNGKIFLKAKALPIPDKGKVLETLLKKLEIPLIAIKDTHNGFFITTEYQTEIDKLLTDEANPVLKSIGLEASLPAILKSQRSVVCRKIDSTIGEKSVIELCQEINRVNNQLVAVEVTKFSTHTHLFKVEFATVAQAQHSLQNGFKIFNMKISCLLYTSPSPRDKRQSRMPSSA